MGPPPPPPPPPPASLPPSTPSTPSTPGPTSLEGLAASSCRTMCNHFWKYFIFRTSFSGNCRLKTATWKSHSKNVQLNWQRQGAGEEMKEEEERERAHVL